LIISRLALHYVEDLGGVLKACHACLAPDGRVVFTVVHPVISSHDARASTDLARAQWVVDDYFVRGPREQDWLGGKVLWHHRTVEDYVAALQGAGFALTGLRECAPEERLFGSEAELVRRRRIPMFLLLAGTRI
jgi:SAM-dependent methyltransferase